MLISHLIVITSGLFTLVPVVVLFVFFFDDLFVGLPVGNALCDRIRVVLLFLPVALFWTCCSVFVVR